MAASRDNQGNMFRPKIGKKELYLKLDETFSLIKNLSLSFNKNYSLVNFNEHIKDFRIDFEYSLRKLDLDYVGKSLSIFNDIVNLFRSSLPHMTCITMSQILDGLELIENIKIDDYPKTWGELYNRILKLNTWVKTLPQTVRNLEAAPDAKAG